MLDGHTNWICPMGSHPARAVNCFIKSTLSRTQHVGGGRTQFMHSRSVKQHVGEGEFEHGEESINVAMNSLSLSFSLSLPLSVSLSVSFSPTLLA